MINRARALAVIGRSKKSCPTYFGRELNNLIYQWGIENVLTDDALHALALRLIRDRMRSNRYSAQSRAHYAAQQEKNRAV